MQRSALLLIVAALVALGTFVWWSTEVAVPPGPPGPGPVAGGEPGPVAPTPPVAPTTSGQDPVPADAPEVLVEVTAGERLRPPPRPVAAASDVEGKPLAIEVLAGIGAGFDASPPTAGLALLRVAFAGSTLLRQVAVEGEAPSVLTVGARFTVSGTVRDERGQALPGATVWFGETLADGSRREASTDEAGAFQADVPGGLGVPCLVRAPGKASSWRVVAVVPPVVPFDTVLEPACELEVQLAATAFDAAAARAFAVPGDAVSSGLAQYPFFVATLSDGVPFDARGRAVIDDLPREATLGIVVRHARLAGAPPVRVVTKGERQRVLVPVQPVSRTVRGRVVDEQGAPLAGVAVWSRAHGVALAGAVAPRFLPPHLDLRAAFATTTAADGSFELGCADAATAVLSLRMHGRAGRDVPLADAARGDLVLPDWSTGAAEFELLPPLPGRPWIASTTLGGGVQANLAADASWRVAVPHAGRFDVVVTTRHGGASTNRRYDGVLVTGTLRLQAPPPPAR
ncbi:MAG: carboxypeptidase regulatory-like domain-containing protein [Planctomycetes bacterium]|nr:carboxypeptidase regulatory-like domain-containing protein [Planctomycetota bacterium]